MAPFRLEATCGDWDKLRGNEKDQREERGNNGNLGGDCEVCAPLEESVRIGVVDTLCAWQIDRDSNVRILEEHMWDN